MSSYPSDYTPDQDKLSPFWQNAHHVPIIGSISEDYSALGAVDGAGVMACPVTSAVIGLVGTSDAIVEKRNIKPNRITRPIISIYIERDISWSILPDFILCKQVRKIKDSFGLYSALSLSRLRPYSRAHGSPLLP